MFEVCKFPYQITRGELKACEHSTLVLVTQNNLLVDGYETNNMIIVGKINIKQRKNFDDNDDISGEDIEFLITADLIWAYEREIPIYDHTSYTGVDIGVPQPPSTAKVQIVSSNTSTSPPLSVTPKKDTPIVENR